jgi:hypothetical protein
MSVAEPAFEAFPQSPPSAAPFGGMVARQLSVWPFAARTARLFVLVDPSLPGEPLSNGLLKAMQQGYFASDGYSQTRAVREAALAAHYVLRHHNRDVLPLNQINAASAVAAVRGDVAFMALAGHAAAFAWRDGELTGQRSVLRQPRPLGLEQDPVITLWRTPLQQADRLVLVCGARWRAESEDDIRTILSSTASTAEAEKQLADALGDSQPASVLLIAPRMRPRHLRLLSSHDTDPHRAPTTAEADPPRDRMSPLRLAFPVLGLLLLGLVALAALAIAPRTGLPVDRIDALSPRMAVRLGATAADVVDLAAGDGALYTLDVVEGAVRAYPLDSLDQQPGPETLLAHAGTLLSGSTRPLAQPVAIEYLPGESSSTGTLAIVDQSRAVVQLTEEGSLSVRDMPTSAAWQELGALGTGAAGELLFLDSRAHQLLAYPVDHQALIDPPHLILDDARAPWLGFEQIAQVLGAPDSIVVRLDDGSVHRLTTDGSDHSLTLPPVAGHSTPISAMASDRSGGVYLADPLDARVVQTTLNGALVRQLRSPALAGVRAIDISLDGHRLYALVATGVLVADIPDL